jgi:carboxymethylenebutenolidase
VAAFEAALTGAGVDHRVISYPGAPHSFFDRKAADFAEASAAAWAETLRFVGAAPGS